MSTSLSSWVILYTHFGLFKNMTQQEFNTTVERKFDKQTVVSHQALSKHDMAVQALLFNCFNLDATAARLHQYCRLKAQ